MDRGIGQMTRVKSRNGTDKKLFLKPLFMNEEEYKRFRGNCTITYDQYKSNWMKFKALPPGNIKTIHVHHCHFVKGFGHIIYHCLTLH